ncbi:nucleotide sugar dehydrogenase (plasmid) [Sinorhizobium meliloti]|uniref:nucleotide sugar dehydrogenase n=1 Tax=Rhizobium meliloti TaxID=382 RepID=UPI002D76B285|nr:nucleotide sugar dehydrogenase [Sinorhizobium meliloti]WRQ69980.1 nucleotide sugar dehydrogenase [Sinorhizobium meliloti]
MQHMNTGPDAEELLNRIRTRDCTIGIMGLGYVGLPLALSSLEAGFRVIGFDIDQSRVALLNRGESGIKHLPGPAIQQAVDSKRFRATSDFSALSMPDAILIAVPTPLTRNREPNLSFVENSARAIADRLRPGQLVVLESTTWPGTTREIVRPLLEATNLVLGKDFYLAYSPEREDPGNEVHTTTSVPKVIGADDPSSLEIAQALYSQIIVRTVPVTSTATAEAVKLTENIFRSVNIALVNELKVIFDRMGIDVWEVIEAAKTKPFGYMAFYPGPGLGGHCIPIDPFYLTWKAREYEVATRFIELAGEVNTNMPHYVVDRLVEALDRKARRGLNESRILLIGMAYKKNVGDTRESPSLRLIDLMERRGAVVDYHDPYVPEIPATREYAALAGRRSVDISADRLASFDAIVITTDHDAIDWGTVVEGAKLVVDTRNVCARFHVSAPNVIKA